MKHKISAAIQSVTPPILWNAFQRARGLPQRAVWHQFGGLGTMANPAPLFEGRFGKVYAGCQPLDPLHSPEATRYEFYNVCVFADLCRNVPGDFLFGGISWGVAARAAYDFVDFGKLDKTFHLVDPFDATTSRTVSRKEQRYNTDPEYVRRQYPADARIAIHQQPIPMKLSTTLAFAYLNTGDAEAEAKSVPEFYAHLSPGGHIIFSSYSSNVDYYERVGIPVIWLPSGQGLVVKRAA
jgi:hypothetical protein